MRNQLTFNFGIQFDKDGIGIKHLDAAIALESINRTAVELFGGYTLIETEGGRKNDKGELVEEKGRSLIVYVDNLKDIDGPIAKMFATIKTELNQEAVLVAQTTLALLLTL